MEVPTHVEQLLAALRAGGFVACPVGGCVRDSLLGRAPVDWDLCASARPEQVKACAAPRWRTLDTGIAHGTVTVLTGDGPVEVTTFRVEGGYSDHRRPDGVRFVADLEEDLARRDFTINAMALDEGGIVDPFGGRADLSAGFIRCVGEPARRFEEDALRILRALRFASCRPRRRAHPDPGERRAGVRGAGQTAFGPRRGAGAGPVRRHPGPCGARHRALPRL